MIGDTLTIDNLIAIYEAMSKIKDTDRSVFFNNYYNEIKERIKEATSIINTLQK